VQYIAENMFLEDSTLLNSLLEDELLQIENVNVYTAVIELVQKISTFRGRQRLEADAGGSFYSVADQAKLFSRVTEDMNRIRHFATSMRNDDTVDCVSYQVRPAINNHRACCLPCCRAPWKICSRR
jgi:hypothetical protein